MSDSVFTKIINGKIPCEKVYEDEYTFAAMDIRPVQEGMVVLFTKEQIENFEDLPEKIATQLTATAQKVMKAMAKTFPEKQRIGLQIEGFEVPHVHLKLIPINSGEEFRAKPTPESNHDKLEALAEKIRSNL